MVVKIINQIIHYVVVNVNVQILIHILLVFHVIVDGNYMKHYMKMNKKEEHLIKKLVKIIYLYLLHLIYNKMYFRKININKCHKNYNRD